MEYLLTPGSQKIEPFAWWEGAFTEEQLDWLQNKAKAASVEAEIGGQVHEGTVDSATRRSKVSWLEQNPETKWVFEGLANAVIPLNAEYFRFSLTGFGEKLQLTNYHEDQQGMYTWHQDFGAGLSRKLSLVLQLSDPKDYEGGELQLLTSKTPTCIEKKRGLITVFPAWTLHQVTPVIKGTRQTLVTWVSGEPFK